MKHNLIYKFLIIALILPCIFLLSACSQKTAYITKIEKNTNGGYTITYSNGKTSILEGVTDIDVPIDDLKNIWKEEHGQNESFSEYLINNADLVISYNIGVEELKEAWQEDYKNGKTSLTYSEFLAQFATVNDSLNLTSAINSALLNCVSIVCKFTYTETNPWTGNSTEKDSFGAGSGVIYSLDKTNKEAYIITNYHVVYDSENSKKVSNNIRVCVYGNENFADDSKSAVSATFIGGSSTYDIAILKITENSINANSFFNSNIKVVEVENSDDICVGEQVFAIGNAQGYGISAVQGIVSVDSENIVMDTSTQETSREIRITAPVNPGNSGGGLFNAKGKLIGIVNAKIVDESVEGIGYAIPLNVAKAIADNIIVNCDGVNNTKAKVVRIGLTIGVKTSRAVLDDNTGYAKIEEQIAVIETSQNSLASTVNLQADDIINSIKIKQTATSEEQVLKVTRIHVITDAVLSCFVGGSIELNVTHKNGTTENILLTFTNANLVAVN